MSILISGASGQIGTNLVENLSKKFQKLSQSIILVKNKKS